jgi:hypothetical protein
MAITAKPPNFTKTLQILAGQHRFKLDADRGRQESWTDDVSQKWRSFELSIVTSNVRSHIAQRSPSPLGTPEADAGSMIEVGGYRGVDADGVVQNRG